MPSLAPAVPRTSENLLSELLAQAQRFQCSQDYLERLDFIVRMGNMAPYNAMLLQVQKPGIEFAASRLDWQRKFRRQVLGGARPLLIMWPFAPVALVYDLQDTVGPPLPDALTAFFRATGQVTEAVLQGFYLRLARQGVHVAQALMPASHAGRITRRSLAADRDERQGHTDVIRQTRDKKEQPNYLISLNRHQDPNVRFSTLVHELGHLLLGHLGPDRALGISGRNGSPQTLREIEAESVSHLVCARRGVDSFAHVYLASQLEHFDACSSIDLYGISKVAGMIETWLGIGPVNHFSEERDGEDPHDHHHRPAPRQNCTATDREQLRAATARMLEENGWIVQRQGELALLTPDDAVGVAFEEFPLHTGDSDFLLVVGGRAAGTLSVEAEAALQERLRAAADRYLSAPPDGMPAWGRRLPFANVIGPRSICLLDLRLPAAGVHDLARLHRPDELLECLEASTIDQFVDVRALLPASFPH